MIPEHCTFIFNPFLTNVLILYPLESNRKPLFLCVFTGYKMETLARNGLSSCDNNKTREITQSF